MKKLQLYHRQVLMCNSNNMVLRHWTLDAKQRHFTKKFTFKVMKVFRGGGGGSHAILNHTHQDELSGSISKVLKTKKWLLILCEMTSFHPFLAFKCMQPYIFFFVFVFFLAFLRSYDSAHE